MLDSGLVKFIGLVSAIVGIIAALAQFNLLPIGGPGPGPTPPVVVRPPTGNEVSLKLSSAAAPRGGKLTVTGTGFQPNESVEIWVHATLVDSATTDAAGAFSKQITIPNDAPPPTFSTTISATGKSSVRTAQAPFHTSS